MKGPKMCCNCLHCARWKKKAGIECHCDLTDEYLGYLEVMDEDNNCKHWEKETKWDLQKKHDSELLDKVGEYLFNSRYASEKIADFDYDQTVTFTKLEWMKIIAELKAEVSE